MPKSFSRTDRAAQVIQQELARILQHEVKDPRIPKFITVTAVKVSSDFRHAKIYVTGFVEGENQPLLIDTLNKMSGFLRTSMGKEVKLRSTPDLHFVYDESILHASKMAEKIDAAIAKEEKEPPS